MYFSLPQQESQRDGGGGGGGGGGGMIINWFLVQTLFSPLLLPWQGVLDRFSQIKPKVIFSVEAVHYNNKVHDHLSKLRQVVAGLPELEKVVLLPFCGSSNSIPTSTIPNW